MSYLRDFRVFNFIHDLFSASLEAFSDGVLAIIIMIVILMFDIPEGNDLNTLKEMAPLFIVYLVSFVMSGMNWANHHHMLQVTEKVNGKIIWANHLYLFTMSFYPVATGWAGKSNFAALVCAFFKPVRWAAYVLLVVMAAMWVRPDIV